MKKDITLKELKGITGIESNMDILSRLARLSILESEKMVEGGYKDGAEYFLNQFNKFYDFLADRGYYKKY